MDSGIKVTIFMSSWRWYSKIIIFIVKILNFITDPAVRDNSALALGTAMKVVGEKSIGPFLVEIDPQILKKVNNVLFFFIVFYCFVSVTVTSLSFQIKECCDKAEILVKQPTQKVNKVQKTISEEPKVEKQSSGKTKVNKMGTGDLIELVYCFLIMFMLFHNWCFGINILFRKKSVS